MMGSVLLKGVEAHGYSVTRSLRAAKSLRLLHTLVMPNHPLSDAKKSLLLKYSNGESFGDYEIFLMKRLIEVGYGN